MYTTSGARFWEDFEAPVPPNNFNIPLMSFHPQQTDWLIWVGEADCPDQDANSNCRASAWYTTDNGRNWHFIEDYVRQCSWARDNELKIDEKLILCESYRDKRGNQLVFGRNNPLELVIGGNFFAKNERKRLFEQVVGFATFSEYLLVAEVRTALGTAVRILMISFNRCLSARLSLTFKSRLMVTTLQRDCSLPICSWTIGYVFELRISALCSRIHCLGIHHCRVQHRRCLSSCHHVGRIQRRVGQPSEI